MKKFQYILAALLVSAGVFSFGSFGFAEETPAPGSTDAAAVTAPADAVVAAETTTVSETEEVLAPETQTETPAETK